MSTHVVVLGAGFGGLELVTRLSESVSDKARITLIDKNDSFMFGFSKLDVMFGRLPIVRGVALVSRRGQAQRRVPARDGDLDRSREAPGRHDAGTYDADILVVALGADYDPAATPGLLEDGYEFYSTAAPSAPVARSSGSMEARSS
jgi:sulfide:quinone oxidoreductase